ncbi:DUF4255 domain-containing protein [Microscilla marina]|uniref:Pvc16 N-terminal domain-containing protein n=1 Tax=Microscilla marina ATCC 23134 TaxID=313606 RepID=A1ZIM2_MICM2|nr:DUF4255 domain-containing protein [Microscilla marina]EAY29890.1 conserved hypothetical protein [Microscilla marina ATCC 23134]
MITPILRLLQSTLTEHLSAQFARNSFDAFNVVVDKLVSRDGKSTLDPALNQVVITLLDIQEERTVQRSRTSHPGAPYHLNLTLLLSVHEKEEQRDQQDYLKGMEYLDAVLGFFQQYPTFTPLTHPNLPGSVEYLQFELANENLRENSYIWTMTGAKHAPSALYKVRSVSVGTKQMATRIPQFN